LTQVGKVGEAAGVEPPGASKWGQTLMALP